MIPLPAIEYFKFEDDFVEDNIRCIPMIVRFKLDTCGIKLKLKAWSKMTSSEREQLAVMSVDSPQNIKTYQSLLSTLIENYTGETVTEFSSKNEINSCAQEAVSPEVETKLRELEITMTLDQWRSLRVLQRFALIKLSRPGHENKNFPKALKEFGII
ncbi:MAG: nitrate reductase associated protein [Bacteroidetes bacterium]|nr:nitrate reductase associated protein [Bacteroidota bacterium]